jgi:general secretion pathway protein C
MRRFGLLVSSQIAQTLAEFGFAIVCGVLLGLWISRISTGTPFPIAPRVNGDPVAAGDPLDGIMTTAPLFGSRRPGGAARNIQALGLIADANGQGGAIVAVEGQPPRAVRVGDRIEGRLVTSIDAHGVTLEGSTARDTVPLIARPRVSLQGLGANSASPLGLPATPAPPPGPSLLGQPLDSGAPAGVSSTAPGYGDTSQQSPTGR